MSRLMLARLYSFCCLICYCIYFESCVFSSKKSGKGKRPGKGGNRFWKSIGLGFKTPREAIEGFNLFISDRCFNFACSCMLKDSCVFFFFFFFFFTFYFYDLCRRLIIVAYKMVSLRLN